MRELYLSGAHTQHSLAQLYGVTQGTIRYHLHRCTTERERRNVWLHKRYTADRIDDHGYRTIDKPCWYTGGRPFCDYEREHVIVWCQNHSMTALPKGMVVHHIDGDKLNNTLSNLWLMTVSAHMKLHSIERKMQRSDK